MKIMLKEGMCEGHGKCQSSAPEVFVLGPDDEEVRFLLDEVPAELQEKVNNAIRLCPRQALAWAEADA